MEKQPTNLCWLIKQLSRMLFMVIFYKYYIVALSLMYIIQKAAKKTINFRANFTFSEPRKRAGGKRGDAFSWWKTRQREEKFTQTRESWYTTKNEKDIIDKQEFLETELNSWKEDITEDPDDVQAYRMSNPFIKGCCLWYCKLPEKFTTLWALH